MLPFSCPAPGCSVHLLSSMPSDRAVVCNVWATAPGRVCGNLAVSRALGDFVYKDRADLPPHEQKMSAAADLTVVARDPDDQVLIVACDGIWDVMTNEQAVSFVLRSARSGNSPAEVRVLCSLLCSNIGRGHLSRYD